MFLSERKGATPYKPKVASTATMRIPFPEQAYTQPLEKNVNRVNSKITRVQRFPEVSEVVLDSNPYLKRAFPHRFLRSQERVSPTTCQATKRTKS